MNTVIFGKQAAKNPVRFLEITSEKESKAETKNSMASLTATKELIEFAATSEGNKVIQDKSIDT